MNFNILRQLWLFSTKALCHILLRAVNIIETETEAAADGFRLRSVLSFGQKVLTQQIFQGPLADGNTDDDIDD